MQSKFYKRFSKVSYLFVAIYAALSLIAFAVLQFGIAQKVSGVAEYLFLALFFILFYSWPFFGLIALGTLLVKFILYKRNQPSEKMPYVREMILHLIFSLLGMAGIFYVYYEKFGFPSF